MIFKIEKANACYPDVEMLPAIANFFNTTVDKLMGTDEKYLFDFQAAISKGLVYECVRIAREGVRKIAFFCIK